MACLFCGSRALAPLYEGICNHYGVAAETHRFLRCDECGIMFFCGQWPGDSGVP